MTNLSITTIILTYNEELHIRRCLDNICPISKKVYVVDSPSTDKTAEICNEYPNVEVVVNKYPGNQADQFNWAIDNLLIDTDWILRIDADEYLLPELLSEIEHKLPFLPEDITGIEIKRRHIFMGKWVKHGVYPVVMMRMCRTGVGRYAKRLMDEHMVITSGKSIVLDNDFCDHSLINISDYCKKHINYANREATVILDELFSLSSDNIKGGMSDVSDNEKLGNQANSKHKKKNIYNKLPLFWRSFFYFLIRFIFKGGFLDGKEGFLFAFIQGWWYRTLVDAKILEVYKNCNNLSGGIDKNTIKQYIKLNWGITL